MGTVGPDDGVAPDLRRPGEPAPGRRPHVPRPVDAGGPEPAPAGGQVRRVRLPGGPDRAVGAGTAPPHLSPLEGPGRASPASRGLLHAYEYAGQGMIIG